MNSIINLIHSITASLLSYYYIQNPIINIKRLLFFISNTYFLTDTYLIRNDHYLDISHHLLSILSLISFYIGYYENILIKLFYLAEMSNISIFGHYLVLKNIENENIVYISSVLEFCIYTYYRCFCMTQILIENHDLFLFTPLMPLLIIYYMSIDWSITLFKNLYYH